MGTVVYDATKIKTKELEVETGKTDGIVAKLGALPVGLAFGPTDALKDGVRAAKYCEDVLGGFATKVLTYAAEHIGYHDIRVHK